MKRLIFLFALLACSPQIRTIPYQDFSAQAQAARNFADQTEKSPPTVSMASDRLAACVVQLRQTADALAICNATGKDLSAGLGMSNAGQAATQKALDEMTANYKSVKDRVWKWGGIGILIGVFLVLILEAGIWALSKAEKISVGGLL